MDRDRDRRDKILELQVSGREKGGGSRQRREGEKSE